MKHAKHHRLWSGAIIAITIVLSAGLTFISRSAASAGNTVTFNKDVAPILFKSCAECHRPGEAAPFSVLSYKDARPWAKSIREQVVSRQMPPWHADPHVGAWANDRRLSQTEIDKIAAWVDGGAPEGEANDLPPAPQFVEGWRIGKPDLVLTMPNEFTLEASGPDEYQNFEIPLNFTEDRYVLKAEARPGNRKIVHHIIAFIVPPAKGDQPRLSEEELARLRAQAEKEMIFFKIPPGAERHRVTGCWTTQEDIHLHSLMPHMHYRGAAMEYKVFYPDGREEVLLNVPNYSFSWQTTYVPKQPIAIPKGTKFLVTGYFDNSAKNKFNPDPTQWVRFGQPTYDEMMAGFISYTIDGQQIKPVASISSSGR